MFENELKIVKKHPTSEKYIKKHCFDFWKFINNKYPNIECWKDKINFYFRNVEENEIFEKLSIDDKEILIPIWNNLTPSQCVESFIKRIYPIFWELLCKNYPNIKLWKKKLNYFRKGIPEKDVCHLVEINGEQILVPSDLVFNKGTWDEKFLKNNYFEFYTYLENTYPFIKGWDERIFLYKNNMIEPLRCPVCGGYSNYDASHSKYYGFCSVSCGCIGSMEQRKQTNLLKYGVNHPMKSQKFVDKGKQTKLEKYGDANYNNPELNKQTCLEKYGVENPMNLPSTREKLSKTKKEKIVSAHDYILKVLSNGNYLCKCIYPECNLCNKKEFEIDPPTLSRRLFDETILCDKYLKEKEYEHRSKGEKKICKILGNNQIEYESNNKNLIFGDSGLPWELDIYLKKHNLAIEVNGQMYHSMFNGKTKKDQHIQKHLKCISKNIELIYVWEDWIENELDLVEQFILDKINRKDLAKYKARWFSDLKENEWPLDLGWYRIPNTNILEHHCFHGKFECFDSGIIII